MLVVVQAFRLQDRLLPVMPDTLALRRRAPAPSDASACDGRYCCWAWPSPPHRFGRPTAISACEKRGLWQCALHLFRDLALEFAR
eukprot:s1093_g9.t2